MSAARQRPPARTDRFDATRRAFLVGGVAVGSSLVVGCAGLAPRSRVGGGAAFPAAAGAVSLNAWLRIEAGGAISVALARAEMGQGVATALPMLVAEELDCDWAAVRYEIVVPQKVHGNVRIVTENMPFRADDTGSLAAMARWLAPRIAGEGTLITGGSTSVRDAWLPLRLAGAAARHAMINAAAQRWGLDPDLLGTRDGQVYGPGARKAAYGDLAAAAATIAVPEDLRLKEPRARRLLGRSLPRLDVPAKTDGSAVFGADVRLPGQLYAAVRMCPVPGGRLESYDAAAALATPGVVTVVPFGSAFGSTPGVLAVASNTWAARRGAAAIAVRWAAGRHASHDSEAYAARLDATARAMNGELWYVRGDLAEARNRSARRIEADYSVPALAHAALEPANCTALYDTSGPAPRLRLWASTQMPELNAQIAAQVAGLPLSAVTLQPTLIGGGFGYKGLPEPVVQAVTAAVTLPNRPVQVAWTREDDLAHDLYRPPVAAHAVAWLDSANCPLAWEQHSAAPSLLHSLVARLAPAWLARRIPDRTSVEGAFDTPYDFGAIRISHRHLHTTLPLGFWRSVGHSHQAFFVESFIDEIAHAGGKDPLTFRLDALAAAPRHLRVLRAAAERAGWASPRASGQAFGLAVHESFGSVCALVIQVGRGTGEAPLVQRVWCAIDCGTVVHPDIVAQQLEGGVIFGLSAALYGAIDVKEGCVRQENLGDYRMIDALRAPHVETIVLPSDEEPGGVGEVATPPAAPALCNAIFALTGTRHRRLPLARYMALA